MSLQACANLVHRADTARWRAAMAAPVAARDVLLPIYAANIEISRAPWVTQEPYIAEMRLQWWRDVLEEISKGPPRRHEVVDAFAPVVRNVDLSYLNSAIDARRWDIAKAPFDDEDDLLSYSTDTTFGALMTAFLALGGSADQKDHVKNLAQGLGVSRLLQAVFDLKHAGANPFPKDWTDEKSAKVSQMALEGFQFSSFLLRSKSPQTAALIECAGAHRFLKAAQKAPHKILEGSLPAFTFASAISRARTAWGLKPPSGAS